MQLGLRCGMEMGPISGNSWFSAPPGNTRPLPWRLHPQVKGEGYPGMLNKGTLATAGPGCFVPVPFPVLLPACLLGIITNELVSRRRKTENNKQLRRLQIISFTDVGEGGYRTQISSPKLFAVQHRISRFWSNDRGRLISPDLIGFCPHLLYTCTNLE